MPKIFDYSSFIWKKFNSLLILKDLGFVKFKTQLQRVFLVKCECGRTKEIPLYEMSASRTKTCGLCKPRCYKHGMAYHPLNSVYSAMKTRCYDKNSVPYHNYGARGIKMCDEWLLDKIKFFNWSLESGYKDGLEIDRINNDGDYEPTNCRWATCTQQARNRRTNKYISFDGKKMTYSEWEEFLGFKKGLIRGRIKTHGWSIRKTLTTPILRSKRYQ